jgi:hypothetical protein
MFYFDKHATRRMFNTRCLSALSAILCAGPLLATAAGLPKQIAITDGASIQAALDSHPGQVIFVPPGDYEISKAIEISHDNSGLVGPGRIVQTNPNATIVVASNADGVRIRDLTLTRSPGTDGASSGLAAHSCPNLVIDNVQVLDNRAAAAAINLNKCVNGRVTNCLVRNYSRIWIDDRTASPNYGFAFNCIDGTGIDLDRCQGMLVQGSRVVELLNLPTPEIRDKFNLGKFTSKNPTKGPLVSQETWDSETTPIWHQGAAIHVGGDPTVSDRIQLLGNYIENAAQGIDIHSDHVIVSENIVTNSALGMKAMHGARNILILGNQFNKCAIWAILLQPGAGSHAAGKPVHAGQDPTHTPANTDGASIIANNIISDFGYGDANWLWGNERDCISLDIGQMPENPPLADVIVTGNIVYDPGRDKILVDGQPTEVPPRYKYALQISGDSGDYKGPKRVRVDNNIFQPGTAGVSNVPLGESSKLSSYGVGK